MTMTLTEAIGWATTALETRAKQWRDAAKGCADDRALWEANTAERNNMADMYEEALEVLVTKGIVAMQVDNQGSVRMVNIKATTAPSEAASEATSESNDRTSQGD